MKRASIILMGLVIAILILNDKLSAQSLCPGIPTVTYEGQVYNTVKIGNQCWLKENLNVGTIVQIIDDQTNDSIVEKYCFDNSVENCSIYGGLYQWDEMMQYSTLPGAQGICPSGWHIPTNEEWCILTTYLDTTVNCGASGLTGTDAGGKMKEIGTLHWWTPNAGATNSSGFTALPAGSRGSDPNYYDPLREHTTLWSSSTRYEIDAWDIRLDYNDAQIFHAASNKPGGLSVRCLKDQNTQSCPGIPTVTYEGQVYNTVQIGTQCWLKENLNVGEMIPGAMEQSNNGTIEKYCYDDLAENCEIYGGLYQWNETMQYSTTPVVQGICPAGWHVPDDAEWCTLTRFIDPSVDCDATGWSGTDAGYKMKSSIGWQEGGNGIDQFGFTALPGGGLSSIFQDLGYGTTFWSSDDAYDYLSYSRHLNYLNNGVRRVGNDIGFGHSVRCIKDSIPLGNEDSVFPVIINLYPNPNDGKFTLSVNNLKNIYTIEILDVEGRMILSEKIRQDSPDELNLNFDLRAYPVGVYLVKIITEKEVYVSRVVIK